MAFMIGASGLSEAAWQVDMAILSIGLFIATGLTITFCTSRNRMVMVACLILYAAMVVLLQPWSCFYAFELSNLTDPDVVDASKRYRQLGIFWCIAMFTFVFSVISKSVIRMSCSKSSSTPVEQVSDTSTA
ncbi:hypothetical protein SH501x_003119 [Pirellulaceae bacterium SH501]